MNKNRWPQPSDLLCVLGLDDVPVEVVEDRETKSKNAPNKGSFYHQLLNLKGDSISVRKKERK